MFAAGSGIAPFLGFVAARTGPGENRLYLGIRTPEDFVEHADLDAAAAAGRLKLSVAFSRADAAIGFDGQRHVVQAGQRRRVDDMIRAEADDALGAAAVQPTTAAAARSSTCAAAHGSPPPYARR